MQKIEIRQLSLDVNLGCTSEEQDRLQKIHVSFSIKIAAPLKAQLTDQLEDTICYHKLCDQIKLVIFEKRYKTIEHMAHKCFETLKVQTPKEAKINIQIHKVDAPIPDLLGGSIFEISEP